MKISIITVSYNSENCIESCINSVINQSYKNIEYISIDGLSTDNTLKVIKKYSKYISVIISEPDLNIYDAMNKGIKIAKGEIIGFLHSDDLYTNNEVLSKVANVFRQNPSLDACYADLIYVRREDISKIVRYWKSNKFTGVNQIQNIINILRSDSSSRRAVLSAWNVDDIPKMALPPCHLMYIFKVSDHTTENNKGKKKLNCDHVFLFTF